MHPVVSSAEYRQRRDRLMAKLGQGTAIFASAPQAVMHNDVEYVFRQDSDFYYLTGFNEPEAIAVFAPHHEEHQFILFVQPKDPAKETWTGIRYGVEGVQSTFGADIAYPIEELDEHLPKYLENADKIHYHLGRDEALNQTILKHWQKQLAAYARRGYGPQALVNSHGLVHPLRQVKSETELALLRRACDLSAIAHQRAMEFARPGHYEYQVQAELEIIFRREGGLGPAYPSIVAAGKNACILHYINNDCPLKDGDLLLIDAGCSYGYYNGDITRTFPINGKFSPEQRTLYEIVLNAQEAAIATVQAGNPYHQYHDAAVSVIVDGLMDLGLLTGDKEEIIKEEKYKPFYMHRTGHWLGLDVHDAGNYKQDKETWTVLEPGQVLTVEPGIYIAPDIKPVEGQPEVPEQWRGIGIRIEDDVLVTAQGPDVLTSAVPKAIADLER
ncbi:aminopeptidase P N-terminal domain-containing protein [Synechocystis salina LEGE 06155]|nr:aminopeptidase P N-terminal domain-containing protein [Synechocystis salina LEGE 06155]